MRLLCNKLHRHFLLRQTTNDTYSAHSGIPTMSSPNNNTLRGLMTSVENALISATIVVEPITWPFVAGVRLFLLACAAVLHKVGNFMVHMTAAFMTAVLRHPDVVDSASQIMVAGMNAFAAQPDLADKLSQVNKHMTMEDKQEVAVQIGRDLPLLVGGILHGVFSRNNDKQTSVLMNGGDKEGEEHSSGENDDKSVLESKSKEQEKVLLYVDNGVEGEGAIIEKTLGSQ